MNGVPNEFHGHVFKTLVFKDCNEIKTTSEIHCRWTFVCMCVLVAQLCPTLVTPQTVAHQAPQSMKFSRQEYWSGLPFPSPGDLPGPGIKPRSPALQADSLPSEPTKEAEMGL